MDYRNKVILAPMVRVSTLPMRLLAVDYGADIVYSDEIVDKKILNCKRVVNEELGTVDLLDSRDNGRVVFRTCEAERGRVVLQLGTADAGTALKAAQMVCKDVAAVDINMGCPKHFSVQGGMGSALLQKPETVEDIVKTLHRNLDIPVTCKIRLLPTPEATVQLAQVIEKSGAAALAVHGRHVCDRRDDPAKWDGIRHVVNAVDLPVIANGDVLSFGDVARIREETGATSVMVARGALWNPSVFRADGPLSLDEVRRAYIRKCLEWDAHPLNAKYVLREMLMHHGSLQSAEGTALNKARTWPDLCALYGVDHFLGGGNEPSRAKRQARQAPAADKENLVASTRVLQGCSAEENNTDVLALGKTNDTVLVAASGPSCEAT